MNYYNNTLSPNNWKLLNPTDLIDVVKKKMRACRFTVLVRHLAVTCNFGEFLKRSLPDQFVCGIRNPATRKKLLSEDRTFQEPLQVAIADEIAA